MPISRHARWMRKAISPRLAMRIFSNIYLKLSQNERSVSGAVAGKSRRLGQYSQYGKDEAGNSDSMLSACVAALAYLPVRTLQGAQRGQRHFEEAFSR